VQIDEMETKKVLKQAGKLAALAAQNKPRQPETEGHYAAPETVQHKSVKGAWRTGDPETETPRAVMDGSLRFAEFVGDTPLVELTHLLGDRQKHPHVRVFAKCEMFNPGFSIKDRIVRNILNKAEKEGRLRKGMTVLAASSGNTGASTAMMCAMRGYDCVITTSPKCSKEKMDAIRAYGAQLLVSPSGLSEDDPRHYMEMARLLALEDPEKYFDVNQYDSLDNPEGHYLSLGPEIWEGTGGAVTHFLAAGSTGGTISGTARYLRSENPNIRVVLADPVGSIFSEYHRTGKVGKPDKFLVEGVGKGSIPGAMNFDYIDDVIQVTDEEAFQMCHRLSRQEGICAGGSSGLNVHAALELAAQLEEPAVVVTVLPDLGVKYLSKVYSPSWLKENGFYIPESFDAPASLDVKGCPDPEIGAQGCQNPHPDIHSYLYRDLVGDTPLVDLSHLVENSNANVRVLAKCEFFNPGFSIKDRIVQNILNNAERDGRLRKGMTVVAASSGNTGASTAMMCAMRGYKCIITTSPKCSEEKMCAIRAYGAELLISPPGAKEGEPSHYMEMARLLAVENPEEYFDMDQYDNLENPEGHYLSLGPEIWEQTVGSVTHFVAAGSTGGTISGTGRFLKEQNDKIEVVLGDPEGSIFAEYFRSGSLTKPKSFLVEGVGKGSIPGAMNFKVIDDVIQVNDQDAFDTCFMLCRKEGICAGGSSGLNLCTALKLAASLTEDATIVTVFPDLGVKYLSKVYNSEWLEQNGIVPPPTPEHIKA